MTRLMAQGQTCGRRRWPCGAGWGGRWLVALVVGLGVSGGELAEGLSDDIRADQYRLEAERALAPPKPAPRRALAALEKYEGVAPERNWEFLYIYGTLLVKYGRTEAEFKKGKALLGEEAESRRGEEEYEAVLMLLTEADDKLKPFEQAAAEAKDRAAAKRKREARFKQLRQGDGIQMVSIPGGSFRMGCTREQRDCADDEQPVHEVQVRAFEIGQYEVTQELWEAFVGENPSHFGNCAQCPVDTVGWYDVQWFLKTLNVQTGGQYRLPTEAEWEYAARGGQQSLGYQYAGSDDLGAVAWYKENSGGTTHPVGQKEPNELGAYDMSGNVWEWVQDCSHGYTGAPADGRAWESEDCFRRMRRGGSWISVPGGLRSAVRASDSTGNRDNKLGVRLARTLTP